MLMGGMLGYAAYEGDINEFLPFLKAGEKLHLGKQTTFGLGKIKLRSDGSPKAVDGRDKWFFISQGTGNKFAGNLMSRF